MTDDPVKRVLRELLHDKGVEVTPKELNIWLESITESYHQRLGQTVTYDQICIGLLSGDAGLRASLQRTFCLQPAEPRI